MAIAVDHKVGDSGASGNTTPVTSSTGNLSVVVMQLVNGNTGSAPTDNKSNTYVSSGVTGGMTGGDHWELWYAKNAATGITGITETWTGGGGGRFYIYDCSGADTSSPLDATASLNSQTATTNAVGPTVTTSASGGIVISAIITPGNTSSIASPFTLDDTPNGYGVAHDANSASGSISPSWTILNAQWGGITVAFKVTGAGGGFTAKFRKTLSPVGSRVGSRQGY